MHPKNTPEIVEKARVLVLEKPSPSYIQRRLMIGYNQATDLIELFEHEGLISKANSAGHRTVLTKG